MSGPARLALAIVVAAALLIFWTVASSAGVGDGAPTVVAPEASQATTSAGRSSMASAVPREHARCAAPTDAGALVVAVVPGVEEHPSCVAGREGSRVPAAHLCFKHGGHFPGCARRGAENASELASLIAPLTALPSTQALNDAARRTFDGLEWRVAVSTRGAIAPRRSTATTPSSSSVSRLVLRDAVVVGGDIYSGAVRAPVTLAVSGIYSMVSNSWPQSLARSVQLLPLSALVERIGLGAGDPSLRRVLASACRRPWTRENNLKLCARAAAAATNGTGDAGADLASAHRWAWGYWQAPTDFLSSYHVVVEVALTMLHTVLRELSRFDADSRNDGGGADEATCEHASSTTVLALWSRMVERARQRRVNDDEKRPRRCRAALPAVVVTSRPPFASFGFKKGSCKHGASACLGTVWATMYATLFSFVAEHGGAATESHAIGSRWCSAHGDSWLGVFASNASAAARGRTVVLGLDDGEGGRAQGGALQPVRYFDELYVGYPTHCEPLWGPDPVLINTSTLLRAGNGTRRGTSMARLAVEECDLLLWIARDVLVRAAASALGAPFASADVAVREKTPAPPLVLFASRRGDWARDVVNEDEFLSGIDAFIHARFCGTNEDQQPAELHPRCRACTPVPGGRRCHVRVARFGGPLERQIATVLDGATIFVAPHGANILPSLFLPANAALITLDSLPEGFYPYGVCPSWLHWRRVVTDRVCNRRLDANRGGRCRVRSANNDDLSVSSAQAARVHELIAEVATLQQTAPKVSPYPSLNS
jgi:hypothetical protein